MLSPEYLAQRPDRVILSIDSMMEAVLAATAKRISQYGWTEQSQWEVDRLKALGVLQSDIERVLTRSAPWIARELQNVFSDAMQETIRGDKPYYEAAEKWDEKAINRAAVNRIIQAGLKQTKRTFTNITGTLAKQTAKEFAAAMDQAWLAAATGVISPQDAGRHAIKQLCRDGIHVVTYPSEHQDTVEVAVRRALVTGINQTAMQTQIQLAKDLDCDLVEVTAHAGARPEHAVWQGKVFSLFGKTPGYPLLSVATGYGTGEGLGGWNCRHSFHPFFPGMTPAYSEDLLRSYEEKKYTYNGKDLTEYEAMEQQRYFERGIRRWKREYVAMEAGGYDSTEAAVRLKSWREKEADFLRQTGRRRDSSRSQIGTFGRSEAAKATWAAKEYYEVWSKSVGVNDAIKTLANYYDVKYNDSPRFELLQRYTKDVKSGWVSPISGFANYESLHNRIETEIVGKHTANGILLTGQSDHFIQRVIGTAVDPKKLKEDLRIIRRSGVEIEDILDALENGIARPPKTNKKTGLRSQKLINSKCEVSVNPDTGVLIQCNPRTEVSP